MRTLDFMINIKRECGRWRLNHGGCAGCPCLCMPADAGDTGDCVWDRCPCYWSTTQVRELRRAGRISQEEAEAALRIRLQCPPDGEGPCTGCGHWSPALQDCVLNCAPFLWYTRKTRAVWAGPSLADAWRRHYDGEE